MSGIHELTERQEEIKNVASAAKPETVGA